MGRLRMDQQDTAGIDGQQNFVPQELLNNFQNRPNQKNKYKILVK